MLFAAFVVLDTSASPMIEGVAQARIAAVSHDDLLALAALPGHWGDARIGPEGMVVTLSQGICTFGHQRRSDNASHAWNRKQQRDVRLSLPVRVVQFRGCHLTQQSLNLIGDLLALVVEQTQLRQKQQRVLTDSLCATRSQRQWWRREDFSYLLSAPAADAMLVEQL